MRKIEKNTLSPQEAEIKHIQSDIRRQDKLLLKKITQIGFESSRKYAENLIDGIRSKMN